METQEKNTKSFYVAPPKGRAHTISTKAIEVTDQSKLIDNLLNEFTNSSREEKNRYRSMLEEWLSSSDENTLFQEDVNKVKDLIYEMF